MVTFLPSMILGECSLITKDISGISRTIDSMNGNLTTIPCPGDGTRFNDLGTLLLNPLEKTIFQLFHNPNYFSFSSLLTAFVLTFFTACWTYGTGVPSGLFVPCLMIGSIYGRLVGNIVQKVYTLILGNEISTGVPFGFYIGTYALVGAASFLGGVVRMTISLAVIILESTNEILFGLPIMLALMIAKWTGDYFNEGLYDIHINLKRMPLLEWDPPHDADLLSAKDVMSKNLTVLREHETVEFIEKVLIEKSHSGFVVVKNPLYNHHTGLSPVELNINNLTFSEVSNSFSASLTIPIERSSADKYEPASFRGLILRSQLLALLHYKVYDNPDRVLTHEEMIKFYPKGLNSSTLIIRQEDKHKQIDLRPYMNPSPYTAFMDTCVTQVYEIFRTMGLRHLVVLDNQGRALGLITRKDLIEGNLKKVLKSNN
ncbi:Chloride transport protein isoform X4 [Oopsacas minuta]|uniref:Chloride channel protein n=1 Tax=Oopsacas minuta TaxID=111878 RepID=A0AAV7KH12_9METZ|nr:Chloride transport protein isoform X4 [Oopsacas minuta]